MKAATKTRTQRRMEKKQALILLVLVLAVSLASFTLGVVVGRQGAERDLAQKQQAAESILTARVPQQTAAAVAPRTEPATSAERPAAGSGDQLAAKTKLTFYDDLTKGEAVPLGSGINLPPKPEKVEKPAVPTPIVKKTPPVTVAKTATPASPVPAETLAAALPKSDPKGRYAVQVGSFAAAGDAGAFKQRLFDKGFIVFVVEVDLGKKGLWYRVRLGPYTDAAAAKSVQQLVEKKEQIKGFVTRQ